ncbi:NAAT family transporter [Mesosutterella sp. OilRF-GAM-744-9]|uniref:UPF0056 membrane protein n=1 Tax=Mesosutterella porci TaxID=2915351 RepID=A0ABS9MNH1_9BURK|nr:MarC family protein [Mesosutterella sp. oilRF-744-WT-GAM-9]MCG5030156.1 NAAT family transporter [Mesosutterella sp. oilRF-744-WT-GAM-9]MCI6530542.1 NAAT family transporter [Mesosutterella sp.]
MFDTFLQSFLLVFATFLPIMNPFGGAMFFLTLTQGVRVDMRARITNRMALFCFIVLMVSIFAGRLILSFFGISLAVLQVGGGLVLVSAGWQALHAPVHTGDVEDKGLSDRSDTELMSMAFYPLTLPLTTGPGTIAAAAAIGSSQTGSIATIFGCIAASIAITLLTWVCFRFSDKIPKAVGAAGADALARLFAFILVCIGISVFWQGFSSLWTTLPQ